MIKALPIEDYRAVYEPGQVECASTDLMVASDEIIGQDRAQKALRFGLEIQEKGFNIYVSGIQGTGRRTAVRKLLDELAKTKPKADDWVYVNNFANQYEPIAIRLPAGMGAQFKADIASFIDEARRGLPKAFESEDYAIKQQQALDKLTNRKGGNYQAGERKSRRIGFYHPDGADRPDSHPGD